MNELALQKGLEYENKLGEKAFNVARQEREKELVAQGYQLVDMLGSPDGDTFKYSVNGEERFGRLPVLDTLERDSEGVTGYAKALMNKNKTQNQLSQVAMMYNVGVDEVTPEMFSNASNYQAQYSSIAPFMSDESELPQWNPNGVYTQDWIDLSGKKAYVKIIGKDYSGKRDIVEFANPNLEASKITSGQTDNALFNSSYKTPDETTPIQNYENIFSSRPEDRQSTATRALDRIEAGFIKFGANMTEWLPDSVENTLNKNKKAEDGYSFQDIRNNPDLALMLAGASSADIEYFDEKSKQSQELFKKVYNEFNTENVTNLASFIVSNPDVATLDSIPYMLISMGGQGVGEFVGSINKPAGKLVQVGTALGTSFELLAQDMQTYRDNNDGEEMPMTDAALGLLTYFASENLEMFGLGKVAEKLFPKQVFKQLEKGVTPSVGQSVRNVATGTATGIVTEAPVEGIQQLASGYLTQDQDKATTNILDYAKENEEDIAYASFMGGVGGGVFSGGVSIVGEGVKALDAPKLGVTTVTGFINKNKSKSNLNGQAVNVEQNKELYNNEIKNYSPVTTPETLLPRLQQLEAIRTNEGLSVENVQHIEKLQIATIFTALKEGNQEALQYVPDNNLKRLAEQYYFGSEPDATIEEKRATLEKIGLSKEDTNKILSMKEVDLEARYDKDKGYYSYADNIQRLEQAKAQATTDDSKASFDKAITYNKNKMSHYLKTQQFKANALIQGIDKVRRTGKSTNVRYSVDDRVTPFTIHFSNLGKTEEGVYLVLDNVLENIDYMSNFLKDNKISYDTTYTQELRNTLIGKTSNEQLDISQEAVVDEDVPVLYEDTESATLTDLEEVPLQEDNFVYADEDVESNLDFINEDTTTITEEPVESYIPKPTAKVSEPKQTKSTKVQTKELYGKGTKEDTNANKLLNVVTAYLSKKSEPTKRDTAKLFNKLGYTDTEIIRYKARLLKNGQLNDSNTPVLTLIDSMIEGFSEDVSDSKFDTTLNITDTAFTFVLGNNTFKSVEQFVRYYQLDAEAKRNNKLKAEQAKVLGMTEQALVDTNLLSEGFLDTDKGTELLYQAYRAKILQNSILLANLLSTEDKTLLENGKETSITKILTKIRNDVAKEVSDLNSIDLTAKVAKEYSSKAVMNNLKNIVKFYQNKATVENVGNAFNNLVKITSIMLANTDIALLDNPENKSNSKAYTDKLNQLYDFSAKLNSIIVRRSNAETALNSSKIQDTKARAIVETQIALANANKEIVLQNEGVTKSNTKVQTEINTFQSQIDDMKQERIEVFAEIDKIKSKSKLSAKDKQLLDDKFYHVNMLTENIKEDIEAVTTLRNAFIEQDNVNQEDRARLNREVQALETALNLLQDDTLTNLNTSITKYTRTMLNADKALISLLNSTPVVASQDLIDKAKPIVTRTKTNSNFTYTTVADHLKVRTTSDNLLAVFKIKDNAKLGSINVSDIKKNITKAITPYSRKDFSSNKVVKADLKLLSNISDTDFLGLQLLVDKFDYKNPSSIKLNNNVSLAVDYAVSEMLLHNSNLFTWSDKDLEGFDVTGSLGPEGVVYSNSDRLARLNELGNMQENISIMLGKNIADKLGLTYNEDSPLGMYETIITSLGQIATMYAIDRGYLSITRDNKTIKEQETLWVKPKVTPKALYKMAKDLDIYEELFSLSAVSNNGIKYNPPIDKANRKIKGTTQDIAPEQNDWLNEYEKQPYVFDTRGAELINEIGRESILSYMGKRTDYDSMSYRNKVKYYGKGDTTEDTTVGSNKDLEKELDTTLAFYDSNYTGNIYFTYNIIPVGRAMVSGSIINYQTNKHIQRWLFTPKKARSTYDFSNASDKTVFAYAVAQAFDYMKKPQVEILRSLDVLLDVDTNELIKALKDKDLASFNAKYKLDLGVEHIGHVLNVIHSLEEYKTAYDSKVQELVDTGVTKEIANTKAKSLVKFESGLLIEVDATTQAYATRALQYPKSPETDLINPTKTEVDKLIQQQELSLNRVNVFTKDEKINLNTFEEKLKVDEDGSKLVLDSYEHFASVFTPTLTRNENGLLDISNPKNSVEVLTEMFNAIEALIPSKGKDNKITSALRTMFKPIVLVIPYGAGRESVATKMVDTVTETVVDILIGDVKESKLDKEVVGQLDTIRTNVANVFGITKEQLTEQLKSKPLYEIVSTKDKNITFSSLMNEIFYKGYGESIFDTIQQNLEKELAASNIINTCYKTISHVYNALVSNEVRNLEQKGTLTVKMYNDVLKKYRKFRPDITSLYAPDSEDYTFVIKSKTKRDVEQSSVIPLSESIVNQLGGVSLNNTTISNKGRVSTFADLDNKANLYQVQTTESYMLQTAIKDSKIPTSLIHDATVSSALDSIALGSMLNEKFFKTNMDMSLIEEAISSLEKTNKMIKELSRDEQAVIYHYRKANNRNLVKTNRNLIDSVDNYGKPIKVNLPNSFYGLDFGVNKSFVKADIDQVLKATKKLYNTKYKPAKERLMSQDMIVANFPSPVEDGIFVATPTRIDSASQDTFTPSEAITNQAIIEYNDKLLDDYPNNEQNGVYYNPNRYGEILSTKLITEPEARLSLLEELQKNEQIDSEEHTSWLKQLVLDILPKETMQAIEVAVHTVQNLNRNKGNYQAKTAVNKQRVSLFLSQDTNLTPFFRKSKVELYAHELVHAVLEGVLQNAEQYGTTKLKRTAEALQLAMAKEFSWLDFIDDGVLPEGFTATKANYDSLNKQQKDLVNKSKEFYDYLFVNRSSYHSLQEFMAYGMTNEKVQNKLKNIQNPFKQDRVKNPTLFHKMMEFFTRLFNAFTGKGKSSEISSTLTNTLYGKANHKYEKANDSFDVLLTLYTDLVNVNDRAINRLNHKSTPIRNLLENFQYFVGTTANNKLKTYIDKLINYNAKLAKEIPFTNEAVHILPDLPDNPTWGDLIKQTVTHVKLTATSKHMRKQVNMFPMLLGAKPEGQIMDLWNNMYRGDSLNIIVNGLTNLTRNLEREALLTDSAIQTALYEAFTKDTKQATEETLQALTKSVLRTDLSVLYDNGYSVEEITSLVKNKELAKTEINRLTDKVKELLDSKTKTNKALNLSDVLAYAMVTGKKSFVLRPNAQKIVEALKGKDVETLSKDTQVELETIIDNLVSLKALELTSDTDRALVADNSVEALSLFLGTAVSQQNHLKRLMGNNVGDKLKGSTQHIKQNKFKYTVAKVSEEQTMNNDYMKLVEGSEQISGFALYVDKFSAEENISGGMLTMSSDNKMGSSFREYTRYDSSAEVIPTHELVSVANALEADLTSSNGMTPEQYFTMSTGLVPIINPYNKKLQSYQATLPYEVTDIAFNNDLDGVKVLGLMSANNVRTEKGSSINQLILDQLIKFMEQNTLDKDYITNTGFKGSVEISPNSDNKFVRDNFHRLPKEFKRYTETRPLFIRADMLKELFGTNTNPSIIDFGIAGKKPFKLLPKDVQRIIKAVGFLWKQVVNLAKQNIIIRTPMVLINNVIGNLSNLMLHRVPFLTAVKGIFKYTAILKNYNETARQIAVLTAELNAGQGDKVTETKIAMLKQKLEASPIHDLMVAGMFQSVVEDVPEGRELANKVGTFITSRVDVPQPVQTVFKNLFMLEGTPINDFLFQATQYSDFVARATLYEHMMKTGQKNEYKFLDGNQETPETYRARVMNHVLDTFINYDKPLASMEQWLNNVGLVMFTRFVKSIQRVITYGMTENPASALLVGASQYLVDTDDILAQSLLFGKHVSTYDLTDVAKYAVIPSPIRLLY